MMNHSTTATLSPRIAPLPTECVVNLTQQDQAQIELILRDLPQVSAQELDDDALLTRVVLASRALPDQIVEPLIRFRKYSNEDGIGR